LNFSVHRSIRASKQDCLPVVNIKQTTKTDSIMLSKL